MSIQNNTLEKNKEVEISSELQICEYKNEKNKADVIFIFLILVLITITSILFISIIFTYINLKNTKIYSGIQIQNVDISNLSKEEAIEKVNKYILQNIPKEITLEYLDYNTTISTEELKISFDVEEAVELAYSIGREKNIIKNNFNILKSKLIGTNIKPALMLDEEKLKKEISDISSKLPDRIIENSYNIEGNNLIIKKGTPGTRVDLNKTLLKVEENIQNLNINNTPLEIITEVAEPNQIDIEKIHNEIYKDEKNAYYTTNPFTVYPSEEGLDFNISIEEAKNLIKEERNEYIIPLKKKYPEITTNMIGKEAFPDILSTFSTNYSVRDSNRTNNLILASNKINGTVLMPGEIFSYNEVVGERTIQGGYKDAPIYVNGNVVDGLGGGICQITTTLYNAVVFANLEIVERSNHQFIPSYVGASRDATVVYGAIDFKFKNTRDYPIKIICSVSSGRANFQILGLKSNNEYEVQIQTRITNSTANSISSEAYKIKKQNGRIISSELLSKDTYKKH